VTVRGPRLGRAEETEIGTFGAFFRIFNGKTFGESAFTNSARLRLDEKHAMASAHEPLSLAREGGFPSRDR